MKKRRNRGKNGKTVGNGSISKTRNSGRISVIWLLLAVVVAVSLTVGACALWLPDRAPALLGSAKEITSAPAGVQEYTGATQVTMIPTVSQTRELVGNASGTVTEDMSSQGLTSGKTAMKVNGVSVVALATATPMYRDLATGDKGDDVLALNNELRAPRTAGLGEIHHIYMEHVSRSEAAHERRRRHVGRFIAADRRAVDTCRERASRRMGRHCRDDRGRGEASLGRCPAVSRNSPSRTGSRRNSTGRSP